MYIIYIICMYYTHVSVYTCTMYTHITVYVYYHTCTCTPQRTVNNFCAQKTFAHFCAQKNPPMNTCTKVH